MPTDNQAAPPNPVAVQSHAQRGTAHNPSSRLAEADYAKEIAVGPAGLLKNAANNLFTSSIIDKVYQGTGFEPDYEFDPDPEYFASLTEGLPQDALDYVAPASSETHAQYLLERYKQRATQYEQIGQWGGVGVAASFAAEFFDPINLVTGQVAGRLATAPRFGAVFSRTTRGLRQTSRLQRALRGAGTGAVVDGGVELGRYATDPLSGPEDVILGIAAGAAFSATSASLSRSDLTPLAKGYRAASDRVSNTYLGRKLVQAADERLAQPIMRTIRENSEAHARHIDSIDADVVPTRVKRSVAAVVNALSPDFLAKFRIRFTGDDIEVGGKSYPNASGAASRAADGVEDVTVRTVGGEGRIIQTAFHEMGEVLYRGLDGDTRAAVDAALETSVFNRRQQGNIAEIIYRGEAGRDPAKLSEPNELFAELFARDAAVYGAGTPLASADVARALREVEEALGPESTDALRRAFDTAYGATPLRDKPLSDLELFDTPAEQASPNTASPGVVFDEFIPTDAQTRAAFSSIRGTPGTSKIGQLRSSSNPAIRKIATMLAPDRVGNEDRAAIQASTVHERNQIESTKFYGQLVAVEPDFQAWKQANGYKAWQGDTPWAAFGLEVSRAVRSDLVSTDPHVAAAVDKLRSLYRDALQYGKDKGLFDADIPENPNYLSRVHNGSLYGKAEVEHGRDAVRDWWVGAMARGDAERWSLDNADDVKALELVSEKIVRKIKAADLNQIDELRQSSDAKIESILDELEADGVDADQINYIRQKYVSQDPAGAVAEAKPRTRIDETYTLTTSAGRLSLEDLIEPNAFEVTKRYVRNVVIAANDLGMRRLLRSEADIEADVIPTWETTLGRLREEYEANHSHDETRAFIKSDLKLLDALYKSVNGKPIFDTDPGITQLVVDLMGVNFIRVGGNFVFSAIPELMVALGSQGMKAMRATLPDLFDIVRNKGEAVEDMADFEYAWRGQRLLNHPRYRVEPTDPMEGVQFNGNATGHKALVRFAKQWKQTSRALQYGRYHVAEVSGLGPINRVTASLAARTMLHRLSRLDASEASKTAERLAELGLSPDDATAIADQLRTHARWSGDGAGTIRAPNTAAWSDQGLAKRLEFALYRKASNAIQTESPGDLPLWADTPMGRLLIQFRRFPMVAFSNHTLRSAHFRDKQAAAEFGMSLIGALATAMLLVHSKALGRDDADQFIAEHTAPDRLFLIALARTPLASLLPGVVDTGLELTAGEPLFGRVSRSSGNSQNLITGNPTYRTVQDLAETAGSVVPATLRSDVSFTQDNARDAAFIRAPGYSNIVNWLTTDMPKQAKSNDFAPLLRSDTDQQ